MEDLKETSFRRIGPKGKYILMVENLYENSISVVETIIFVVEDLKETNQLSGLLDLKETRHLGVEETSF